MLYKWIKKLHMWSGLLSFTAFVVWGITGIHAVFLPAPGNYRPPEISSQQEFGFEAPGNLDDKEIADLIFKAADLNLAGSYYNVHRDGDQNLAFFVYTPNGRRDLTYVEDESLVRVLFRDNGLGNFFSVMHGAHSRRPASGIPVRVYSLYNEFATWAFLFMSFSGLYMWIATRPGLLWARVCMGATTIITLFMWWAVR